MSYLYALLTTLSLLSGVNNVVLSNNVTSTHQEQPDDTIKLIIPNRSISLEELQENSQPNTTLSFNVTYTIPKIFFKTGLGFDPSQARDNYTKLIDLFLKKLLQDEKICSYNLEIKNKTQIQVFLETTPGNVIYVFFFLKKLSLDEVNSGENVLVITNGVVVTLPKEEGYSKKTLLPLALEPLVIDLNMNYTIVGDPSDHTNNFIRTTDSVATYVISQIDPAAMAKIGW